MAYTPKYVELSDIPVQIPDDYDQSQKEDALEIAEGLLESDLASGNEIPDADVTALMRAAVKQRATCELAKGTESNDDVALGDLDDSGTTKSDYAEQSFCNAYDDIIAGLRESGVAEDLVGGESLDEYVYNTADPDT